MHLISTAKCPRIAEAAVELGAKLFGIYVVYEVFNWFVSTVLQQDLSNETLLSLLLLPALYVLKDFDAVIDPATVKVERHHDKISVTRGLNPKIVDTLEFKNVENTEIITTLLGRLLGYSTIRLYSPGGLVEMPYVYQADKVLKFISRTKTHITNRSSKDALKRAA